MPPIKLCCLMVPLSSPSVWCQTYRCSCRIIQQ